MTKEVKQKKRKYRDIRAYILILYIRDGTGFYVAVMSEQMSGSGLKFFSFFDVCQ